MNKRQRKKQAKKQHARLEYELADEYQRAKRLLTPGSLMMYMSPTGWLVRMPTPESLELSLPFGSLWAEATLVGVNVPFLPWKLEQRLLVDAGVIPGQ